MLTLRVWSGSTKQRTGDRPLPSTRTSTSETLGGISEVNTSGRNCELAELVCEDCSHWACKVNPPVEAPPLVSPPPHAAKITATAASETAHATRSRVELKSRGIRDRATITSPTNQSHTPRSPYTSRSKKCLARTEYVRPDGLRRRIKA